MLMRYWKARLGLSLAVLALPLLAGFTAARQEGKVKKPEWKHAVAVKVRPAGKDKFDDAKKVGIEIYADPNSNKLLFIAENGSISVRPGAAVEGKGKVPEWSHAMELKVRKAGEKEFGKDTKKYGVEVYYDANAKTLIYVSETGSLAVVPGAATPEGKGKDPTWKAAMDLRVRKAREPDFGKDTKKHGVEVYLDENNQNLIFITEAGNIWVVDMAAVDDKKSADPEWRYGLEVDARKADEKEFTGMTQRYGMEVYSHDRTGTLVYITEQSTISGSTGK